MNITPYLKKTKSKGGVCSQKLLRVSFNIDILSGPWSIGHVFSKEMVRLTNLDRLAWFSQGPCVMHDVSLTFGVNKSTITSLMTRYRDTGDVKDRAKNGCPRKTHRTDNSISGMAARRRSVTANGIRTNVQNPRLSDQTIIIHLHRHGFGSRRSMKVPQRTDRHELAI